jgi:signal transduction histidine kinase
MNINVLGMDIAKNIFQLHGADKNGKRTLNKGSTFTLSLTVNAQLIDK